MAAPAVTAEEVGQILTYLAPGFFAQAAYRYRFPRRRRSDFDASIQVTSDPIQVASARGGA